MTIISGGLAIVAILLFIWGDAMRGGLPKFDIFLASAAASPVATNQIAQAAARDGGSIRFFSAPIYEFTFSGRDVFLTAPDVLALASSFVLLVRFFAWVISSLKKRKAERSAHE